jgi:hypothetical protein
MRFACRVKSLIQATIELEPRCSLSTVSSWFGNDLDENRLDYSVHDPLDLVDPSVPALLYPRAGGAEVAGNGADSCTKEIQRNQKISLKIATTSNDNGP